MSLFLFLKVQYLLKAPIPRGLGVSCAKYFRNFVRDRTVGTKKIVLFFGEKTFFSQSGFLARGKIDLPSCGAKIDEKKPKTHPEKKSKIPDV